MKRKYIGAGLLAFILSLSVQSQKPVRSGEAETREFKQSGVSATSLSFDGLSLITEFLSPETMPATSDPVSWKLISEKSVAQNLAGIAGSLRTLSFSASTGQVDCQVWTSSKKDLFAFRQVFTNKTKKPVRLLSLYPLYIGERDFIFGNVPDWRILEQFRHKNDMPGTEIPAKGKKIVCDPFFIINSNRGSGSNLLIGYQTFSLHLAELEITFDNELRPVITAECDFEGIVVPPDGSRVSQWVIISNGNDANQLIEEYTGRIREYYDMPVPPGNAPAVYCTWYYHADTYNEDIFRTDVSQFRKEHLPFDVFLIDECWDVNDWGDFEANESFPGGMKWVAGEINSQGYTAGIWTAPFLVDGESDLAGDHPSWLLKNSKGELCTFFMNTRDHYILDLTYPGVCEYLEEQFRKLSDDWGYRYFKFDFMRSVFIESDQQFHDKSATSLEAYRRGLEAIRRGVGQGSYISVCGGHYGASYGIANSQRSGSDVKSQWNENELPKYRQNILRTWMSGLWHVDPDAMMVRRQEKALDTDRRNLTTGLFTDDEAFTNTINQFLGGELITFTEDFSRIDTERKMLYRHVIPSVNSASRPVDLFNTNSPEIMVTPVKPACDKLENWNMVTIVNWSNSEKDYEMAVNGSITSGLKGDRFLVYDFGKAEILAYVPGDQMIRIPGVKGHQSRLLKIVPWDGLSGMFVGTDLNFACGGLEIADIESGNGIIEGTLETDWNVPVKLAFVIPSEEGYILRQITAGPGQKRFSIRY